MKIQNIFLLCLFSLISVTSFAGEWECTFNIDGTENHVNVYDGIDRSIPIPKLYNVGTIVDFSNGRGRTDRLNNFSHFINKANGDLESGNASSREGGLLIFSRNGRLYNINLSERTLVITQKKTKTILVQTDLDCNHRQTGE